jgi:hypothetical protein
VHSLKSLFFVEFIEADAGFGAGEEGCNS